MQKLITYLKKYGPYLNNSFGGGLPFYPFGIAMIVGGLIGLVIGVTYLFFISVFRLF